MAGVIVTNAAARNGIGADCTDKCWRRDEDGEVREHHCLVGAPECPDHDCCMLHSGVHYRYPKYHTIIRDLGPCR